MTFSGKARLAQAFRRTSQLTMLLFIFYAASSTVWRNYKVAHNNPRIVGLIHGPVWEAIYTANEKLLSLWKEPYAASLDFLGMPWGMRFFGFDFVDPIVAFTLIVTTHSTELSLLLAAAVPLILAALVGKIFCSHLCPMRLLFELGQMIRGGLLWLDIPLGAFRSSRRFGGWLLLGGLGAASFAGFIVWYLLLPYIGVGAAIFLSFTGGAAGLLLIVPALLWLIDALLAPGFFCHNLCPQGFLLEQAGRKSLLKLQVNADVACPKGCSTCQRACPYSLKPDRGSHTPACDNCGVCVSTCPKKKLSRGLSLPVISALVLLFLFTPDTAHAHHNKGLPHYGYYDNYPQVPTEEGVVIQGTWEMGCTVFNFQGYDRRTADTPNDVKFFIYLYDLKKDFNYAGPMDFELRLDGKVVGKFSRPHVDEEMIYSTRETLPQSGEYELVALPGQVGGPKRAIIVPFEVDLGDSKVNPYVVGAITLPVLALFGLALLGRTRRGRSRRLKAKTVESLV